MAPDRYIVNNDEREKEEEKKKSEDGDRCLRAYSFKK